MIIGSMEKNSNSVSEMSQKNLNANQGTNGFVVPSLSLPKGGGAIRSILIE
jgi:hypothetical protein